MPPVLLRIGLKILRKSDVAWLITRAELKVQNPEY
jgi:hypothetical protein